MSWDAIGAIGELVGATAVVATLSRSAILDLAANDRLAEISAEIRDFENEDVARRYNFYQSFFRLHESASRGT